VGPLFIRGEVEFGVITQSAMAFSHLLGAFSLVVTQFGSISSYAAVLARLRALVDAAGWIEAPARDLSRLEVVDGSERLAWEQLTLRTPEADQVLIAGLTATVEPSSRWLVTGPNVAAQAALLRASAGLWRSGEGRILRPEKTAFLPESPYLPPSTLAELLALPREEAAQSRARVARLLEPLGLGELVERAGGFDREADWERLLSLREQQLLAIARILAAAPPVALLHEIGTTLDADQVAQVISLLSKAGVAVVMVGKQGNTANFDAVLELDLDGQWRLSR
jgi:putative ATP-binding cassette transporter